MQREMIESRLGYRFHQVEWLRLAFTHPSVGRDRATQIAYERLEYLGDAVLELVVSAELFRIFDSADEGMLTKMRAAIVSRKHLAGLAEALGWGDQLSMSAQLERSGGRRTLSILANTFESAIGAVMMDAGYDEARRVALRLLEHSLSSASSLLTATPKGELQELLQAHCGVGPTYRVEQQEGMPPAFSAVALWGGFEIGRGAGSSKHKAEIAAAADALCTKAYHRYMSSVAEQVQKNGGIKSASPGIPAQG